MTFAKKPGLSGLSLKPFVGISLALHALVSVVVFIAIRSEPKISRPAYDVSLVGEIKVDLRPSETKAPEAERAKEPAKKEEKLEKKPAQSAKTAKTEIVAAQGQTDVSKAIKRIDEALKKKEALKKSEATKKASDKAKKEASAEEKKYLEKIRKDLLASDALGAASTSRDVRSLEGDFRSYYDVVKRKVDEAWVAPGEVKKELIVSIKIGKNGRLLDSWIEAGTGNAIIDESLLAAIKRASPFPPLPHGYRGASLEMGLRFCPDCK